MTKRMRRGGRMALAALLVGSALSAGAAEAQNVRLEAWMTEMSGTLGGVPLNRIAMPGSHDAGTYRIHRSPGWSGGRNSAWLTRLMRSISGNPFEAQLVAGLSRARQESALNDVQGALWATQSQSIVRQLELGVRYFDFRVSWDPEQRAWFLYHGTWVEADEAYFGPMSHSLESELPGIARFAATHPGEVFVLHLRKLNGGGRAERVALYRRFDQLFRSNGRSRLAPGGDGGLSPSSRLQEFVEAGTNVVLLDDYGTLSEAARAVTGSMPQPRIWGPASSFTAGVNDSNGYVNAPSFRAILDQVERTLGAREMAPEPTTFQVTPVVPPANNLKYWASAIYERYVRRLPGGNEVNRLLQSVRVSCPGGSLPDLATGQCFRCPGGFDRNPLVAPNADGACTQPPREEQRAGVPRGAPTGLLRTDCPRGAILNIADARCYACPSGFAKNNLQTDMRQGNACLRHSLGSTRAAEPVGRARGIGSDRYFDPQASFLTIGRGLNGALMRRLGRWSANESLRSRLNVLMVDNVAMAREPGDTRVDPSLMQAIVAMNRGTVAPAPPPLRVATEPGSGPARTNRLIIGQNEANYGRHRLVGGFTPDPHTIGNVRSGGSEDVATMGLPPNCRGFATRQPDVVLDYSQARGFLRFYVQAEGDTVLVINDARGNWHCNDDTAGRNPQVDIRNPPAGHYDIWVASYARGQNTTGTLHITELTSRSVQP